MSHTAVDDPAHDPSHDDDPVGDADMLDEEWLAAPKRRSRLRIILAALLAASLCFLGGAYVQKQYGAEETEAGTFPGGLGAGGLPEGLTAGGGFPGFGQATTGTGADPNNTNDSDSSEKADDAEAVIGTVVEIRGEVWIVEDLGGKRQEIRVTEEADIVRETELTASQVKVGDRIDVTGTSSNGQVQADEVTLR